MAKPRTHDFPAISIRVEPNHDGSEILWKVHVEASYVRDGNNKRYTSTFGTTSNGFASSPMESMQKASSFVEKTLAPNVLKLKKPTLVVDNKTEDSTHE